MSRNASFYWHDYETFGADPARDRPAQFAGLRTDENLEQLGEPLVLYCRAPVDYLPEPEACLITGITPRLTREKGVTEREFVARLHDELAAPATCGVGYNSIRFDDEFTRYALYRNFYDPYEREYKRGNSRWDLIDLMRTARALRPEGIEWPDKQNGRPSFRLEDLARANGIEHTNAHDALADVRATLALARLLRRQQPRLWEHGLKARDKSFVKAQISEAGGKPLLHISSRFPSENGCAALVLPLLVHPRNPNSVIACNLLLDPTPLSELDAVTLREHAYTATADLPAGARRVPLKEIHVNRSPMLAPASALTQGIAARLGIDLSLCREHLAKVNATGGLVEKLREAFSVQRDEIERDAEQALYSGGFVNDADRARYPGIRAAGADELARFHGGFDDPRLDVLLFRYRARNFPQSLDEVERARWREHCRQRCFGPGFNLVRYRERIEALCEAHAGDERALGILRELQSYGHGLCGEQ